MKKSINNELLIYIEDYIKDNDLINEDLGDIQELHNDIFNTDYYIIGYYNCEQWLKKHNINTFEAIEFVQQYELDNFGDINTDINSERIVNMITYIVGEQILFDFERTMS